MAGHGRKNKDEPLLVPLACGVTVEAAVRAVGLSGRAKARSGRFGGRYDRVGNQETANSLPHG